MNSSVASCLSRHRLASRSEEHKGSLSLLLSWVILFEATWGKNTHWIDLVIFMSTKTVSNLDVTLIVTELDNQTELPSFRFIWHPQWVGKGLLISTCGVLAQRLVFFPIATGIVKMVKSNIYFGGLVMKELAPLSDPTPIRLCGLEGNWWIFKGPCNITIVWSRREPPDSIGYPFCQNQ